MNAGITTTVRPLAAEQLYRSADLSGLAFTTTAELQPIDGLVGQARAVEAIRFGTQVGKAGFNLFVIGPNGARMQDAVKTMLAAEAAGKPGPSDWVYDRGPRRVPDVHFCATPDRRLTLVKRRQGTADIEELLHG